MVQASSASPSASVPRFRVPPRPFSRKPQNLQRVLWGDWTYRPKERVSRPTNGTGQRATEGRSERTGAHGRLLALGPNGALGSLTEQETFQFEGTSDVGVQGGDLWTSCTFHGNRATIYLGTTTMMMKICMGVQWIEQNWDLRICHEHPELGVADCSCVVFT